MKAVITNGRAVRQCLILMLCATGISCAFVELPKSFSINPPSNRVRLGGGVARFACPVGFFRLKRNCYYLSAGTAPWREAYFHCKDRNSTLATLDKNGKDRTLRKYLMGDQFTKLERWIGGIYNWQQMAWEWGVSGDKVVFQNFDKLDPKNPKEYAWHCVVMDPSVRYKWKPRSCVERKHYICEVHAGRLGRRRRKRIDPNLVPQNQRLKPKKKGKKYKNGEGKKRRGNRVQQAWRRDWERQNRNGQWANGVKIGSRPPTRVQLAKGERTGNRTRHGPSRLHPSRHSTRITQLAPQGHEYSSFAVPAMSHSLAFSENNEAINQVQAKINDLSLEEILLKDETKKKEITI